MKAKIAIVIEKAGNNYSAYAPDIAGCIATGDTVEHVKQVMAEALAFHLEDELLDAVPTTLVDYVEVEISVIASAQ